jgi:large-conductance mechanosensitive channel
MFLIRFALVSLIIFLVVRSFIRIGEESSASEKAPERGKKSPEGRKKISKHIGEYVDYEDINK